MGETVRVGTNTFDNCSCGGLKLVSAAKCRDCATWPNQRKVVADGVEYVGVAAAARALGVSEPVLRYRCKSGSKKFARYYYK